MENHKKSFFEAIKELILKMTNADPEEVIYNIEYMDIAKGANVKEKVYFHQFKEDLDKKIRVLNSFVRGPAYQKISAMPEDQIIGHLDRNIRDVQNLHRSLGGLDDFFKANVVADDRSKIKGVKPELSALKNTYVKANQIMHEYNSLKEEEEQIKRLGLNPDAVLSAPDTALAPTSSED
jgi:hypothetical protein